MGEEFREAESDQEGRERVARSLAFRTSSSFPRTPGFFDLSFVLFDFSLFQTSPTARSQRIRASSHLCRFADGLALEPSSLASQLQRARARLRRGPTHS